MSDRRETVAVLGGHPTLGGLGPLGALPAFISLKGPHAMSAMDW